MALGSLGLSAIALLATMLIEVPISQRILTWTPKTLPQDWQKQRDRWSRFHIVRIVAALIGLELLAEGAIF
jgi:hypothetical protein